MQLPAPHVLFAQDTFDFILGELENNNDFFGWKFGSFDTNYLSRSSQIREALTPTELWSENAGGDCGEWQRG